MVQRKNTSTYKGCKKLKYFKHYFDCCVFETEKGDSLIENEVNCLEDDLLMMLIRCRRYKIHSAYERVRIYFL